MCIVACNEPASHMGRILSPYAQFSWCRLHSDPNQDEAVAEDE